MDDEILTIKEVGKYLKISDRSAYRLAQEGTLPAFKVGGSWRVRRADLDAWITRQVEMQSSEREPDPESEPPSS